MRLRAALLVLPLAAGAPISAGGASGQSGGDVFVADALSRVTESPPDGAGAVIRIDPASGRQTVIHEASTFRVPIGIALDAARRILVTEIELSRDGVPLIKRIDPATGAAEVLCEGGLLDEPSDLETSADGSIYIVNPDVGFFGEPDGVDSVLVCDPRTGELSTVSSGQHFEEPTGLALEPDGRMLIADPGPTGRTGAVIRVDPDAPPDSNQALVAESGLVDPFGIASDPACGTFLTEVDGFGPGGRVRRLDPRTGELETVCPELPLADPLGIALQPDCSLLVTDVDFAALSDALDAPDPLDAIRSVPNQILRCDPGTGAVSALASREHLVVPIGLVPEPSAPTLQFVAIAVSAALTRRRTRGLSRRRRA